MANKKRLTMHSGRSGKNGVFSSKHNDRNFDVNNAENIDPKRTPLNEYWMWDGNQENPSSTFDDGEEKYYAESFSEFVKQRNEAAERSRHPERKTSAEKLRKTKRTAPDETHYQIGKKDNHIDALTLKTVFVEFIKWRRKVFPLVFTLNAAVHLDEATPHIQERVVWIAHDENGNKMPNQSKSLQEMGVVRPDPSKPESRYNNAKMTYTEACRTKMQEICKAHGIELILDPAEPGKKTLDLRIWQVRQDEKKLKELQEQIETQNDVLTIIKKCLESSLEIADQDNGALYPPGVKVKESAFSHTKEVRGITPEMWEKMWTSANARDQLRKLSKKTAADLETIRASISYETIVLLQNQMKNLTAENKQLKKQIEDQGSYIQDMTNKFNAFKELCANYPELKKYEKELERIFNGDDAPVQNAPETAR